MILPQLDATQPITEDDQTPSLPFHKWWQTVITLLNRTLTALDTDYIKNTGTITSSTATTTHKLSVDIDGVTYYILLSNV
jgi:hypothetical protein